MTPAVILTIINSAIGAIPELLALYDRLKSGGTVTTAEVIATLNKYQLDHTALDADLAAGT
jgi:hypothetical protein